LISKNWIKEATTPSPAQISYGYMWWLNKKGTNRFWEGVPQNVFYASGFGGNYIVIIPDEDIVIVTRWLEPSQIGIFVKKIIDAL
jgi:CubicO group peptidase (beta-lactamase class C family)